VQPSPHHPDENEAFVKVKLLITSSPNSKTVLDNYGNISQYITLHNGFFAATSARFLLADWLLFNLFKFQFTNRVRGGGIDLGPAGPRLNIK
jgi:hypothetical protein